MARNSLRLGMASITATMHNESKTRDILFHTLAGCSAFLFYQVFLEALLNYLRLDRNRSLLGIEILVFGLVTISLYCYSLASRLKRAQSSNATQNRDLGPSSIAGVEQLLGRRLIGFYSGIDYSLSAIMFFTRTQLRKATTPQAQRDLREVMERIDQIKLLLLEMQKTTENLSSLHPQEKNLSNSWGDNTGSASGVDFSQSEGTTNLNSLRKTARKVIILPVTVQYRIGEAAMEFHTYTVNLCENGACIVFSGDDLAGNIPVDIQIPKHFSAEARIRWIQPPKENSFRLAGVEFLDQKIVSNT